jgi:hypothetical protein
LIVHPSGLSAAASALENSPRKLGNGSCTSQIESMFRDGRTNCAYPQGEIRMIAQKSKDST